MALGYNLIKAAFISSGKFLYNINHAAANVAGTTNSLKKTEEVASRTFTATTGGMALVKGGTDATRALLCNDGPCFVISCIGCCADGLQIIGSFVPGPNVTTVITMPISYSCKFLVWLCRKDSSLPWGKC